MSMALSMFATVSFNLNSAIASNDEVVKIPANRLSEIRKIKSEVEQELLRKETAHKKAKAELEEAEAKLKKAKDNMNTKGMQFTSEDQHQVVEATVAAKPYQEAYKKAKDELDKVKKTATEVAEQETFELNQLPKHENKEVSLQANPVTDNIYKMLDSIQIKVDNAREAQNKLMERLGDALNKASDLSYSEAEIKKYTDYHAKLAKKIEDMNMIMEQFITNLNQATQAGLGKEVDSSNGDRVKRKVESPKTVDKVSVLKQAEEKINETRKILAKATEAKTKLWDEVQAADEKAEQARQNLVRAEARATKTGQSKDASNEVKLATIVKERADQTLAKLESDLDDAIEEYQNADIAYRTAEYALVNAKVSK